jgi:hypothetical protein
MMAPDAACCGEHQRSVSRVSARRPLLCVQPTNWELRLRPSRPPPASLQSLGSESESSAECVSWRWRSGTHAGAGRSRPSSYPYPASRIALHYFWLLVWPHYIFFKCYDFLLFKIFFTKGIDINTLQTQEFVYTWLVKIFINCNNL